MYENKYQSYFGWDTENVEFILKVKIKKSRYTCKES